MEKLYKFYEILDTVEQDFTKNDTSSKFQSIQLIKEIFIILKIDLMIKSYDQGNILFIRDTDHNYFLSIDYINKTNVLQFNFKTQYNYTKTIEYKFQRNTQTQIQVIFDVNKVMIIMNDEYESLEFSVNQIPDKYIKVDFNKHIACHDNKFQYKIVSFDLIGNNEKYSLDQNKYLSKFNSFQTERQVNYRQKTSEDEIYYIQERYNINSVSQSHLKCSFCDKKFSGYFNKMIIALINYDSNIELQFKIFPLIPIKMYKIVAYLQLRPIGICEDSCLQINIQANNELIYQRFRIQNVEPQIQKFSIEGEYLLRGLNTLNIQACEGLRQEMHFVNIKIILINKQDNEDILLQLQNKYKSLEIEL